MRGRKVGNVGRQTKLTTSCSFLYHPDVLVGSQHNNVKFVDNTFSLATMVRFKDVKMNIYKGLTQRY